MSISLRILPAAIALAASVTLAAVPARAADGVKVGVLTCNVASGWGFVFGSSKDLKCGYQGASGVTERYSGTIARYGIDIGYSENGVMVWAVVAPTKDLVPGALAGEYGGASGSAALGIGAGANVLLGGFDKSVALQPVSIEGMTGLNVAAGIAQMTLKAEK